MSLFDVIRYPIDENFRLEDLERMPWSILVDWWKHDCEDKHDEFPANTEIILSSYGDGEVFAEYRTDCLFRVIHSVRQKEITPYLSSLRKRIEEYEPI